MCKKTPPVMRLTLPLLTISALLPLNVTANDETKQNAKRDNTIENIVVVGETTNTAITPEQLERQQANDLSDVFRHIPSVSVGGSLGIAQKVYVRGMEDTLLNITVDGAPQTSTLFHHIGRVSIEPELLQKVEVQAGAGEATSGAGAIGGAIRFRTKDAQDLLAPNEDFGAIIKGSYFTNNGEKVSASVYGKFSENWGGLASFVRVNRDNQEDGDGNELYGTAADQELGFIKINGRLTDNQYLSISYEQRKESGEFGQRPNWPALEDDTLFPMDGERKTFVINHSLLTNDAINLETTLYNTTSEVIQDRFDRWGKYSAETRSIGFDIRNTSRIGQHAITYGVDMREDTVTSQYLSPASMWQPWAWDPAIRKVSEEGQVQGVFIQDHWQITNKLLLSFGARYDNYELEQVTYGGETDSDGVSPNVGASYSINDNLKLTVGYAEAMRGKEVGDGFTVENNPLASSLDPNLNPEEVSNSEIGLEYNNGDFSLITSVYQSNIDDVIIDQLGQGVYFENIGELKTQGFELFASYQWEKLNISASFSKNDPELNGETVEGYEHIGLGNARGNTWGLEANYFVSSQLEFGWNFTLVQDLNDIEVLHRAVDIGWISETQTVDKPGYQVHDIYLTWSPLANDSLKLNFAVQNVFDEQYRDHSSVADYNLIPGWEGIVGINEPGRDIRLSLSYRF